MAGQQHDETVAQQDVTSHEKVVAETVTKSRNMRDTSYVALRATREVLRGGVQLSELYLSTIIYFRDIMCVCSSVH